MLTRLTPFAALIAVALTACGETQQPPAPSTPPTATAQTNTAAAADAATDSAPAAAADACMFNLEGDDKMQYNVKEIIVPASCAEFTINLSHTGRMPVGSMGHNVVIASTADMPAVNADGIAAGPSSGYVKPDDARIIAHSNMIGGGESTSIHFATSKIAEGGPYSFFCSFPGHFAMMQGSIRVQ